MSMASRRARVVESIIIVVIALGSIALALVVTPMQQVSAAGQTIQVGTTAPTWSLSGPGELDLFGQQFDTITTFVGPVRPRLSLTHISLSQQLAEFAGGKSPAKSLEDSLVTGWTHYFIWQTAIAGLIALVLLGALSGWQRFSRKRTVAMIVIGLILTEALNVGAIMVTAFTAPQRLGHISSLQALVGSAPPLKLPSTPTQSATPAPNNSVVVLGDSTAAGLGNPLVANPTPADKACNRSRDSYAAVLATASASNVTNLACSGATIVQGILGDQKAAQLTIQPQIDDPAVKNASTIIVSIGANDLQWADFLRVCAVSVSCDDNAEQAFFQQRLASFSTDYLQLLSALQVLPQHPRVLVNLYYDPITANADCLSTFGITADKQAVVVSQLNVLNFILANGAKAAGFLSIQPNFSGHGLCDDDPWVQGVKATAPFHPTASGELAIALADERALGS